MRIQRRLRLDKFSYHKNNKCIGLRMSASMIDMIDKYTLNKDISRSSFIRRCVVDFVKKDNKELRELQEAFNRV